MLEGGHGPMRSLREEGGRDEPTRVDGVFVESRRREPLPACEPALVEQANDPALLHDDPGCGVPKRAGIG